MSARSPLRRIAALTEEDRELIALLQVDGRRSYAQLGRALGITERTAARRVTELRDLGVIQIVPVGDHRVLGYGTVAVLAITVRGELVTTVARKLAELDSVPYVHISSGRYDIFAEVCCLDSAHLLSLVQSTIRETAGVETVETFPYLRLYYQEGAMRVPGRDHRDLPVLRMAVIDDVDRAIIEALSRDGRIPLLHIADEVGGSEALVRRRLKRLQQDGIIRVMAIVNPMTMGFEAMARLAIKVSYGHSVAAVADALGQMTTISYVAICLGRFDIFGQAVCMDMEELELVIDRVRCIEGVAECEAMLYLDLHYKPVLPASSNS